MPLCASGLLSLLLAGLVAGCGAAPRPRPRPPRPLPPPVSAAPTEQTASAAEQHVAEAPNGDFVVAGEEALHPFLLARVAASPLWQSYFEARESAPSVAKPFVRFAVSCQRIGETVDPAVRFRLVVSNGVNQERLYEGEAAEGISHGGLGLPEILAQASLCGAVDALLDRAAFKALCAEGRPCALRIAEAAEQHPEFLTGEFVEFFLGLDPEPPLALRVLKPALASSDVPTQRAAVNAVLRLTPDTKQAIPLWAQLLNHPGPRVREKAVGLLSKAGPAAAQVLVNALVNSDPEVQVQAEAALVYMGPDCPEVAAQVQRMVELAKSATGFSRRLVTRTLAAVGGEGGMKVFAGALLDSDPEIWKPATGYLWPHAAKARTALPELRQVLTGPNRDLRFFVLDVLKAVGLPARDTVALALRDSGPMVRLEAARILAGMGPDGAAMLAPFANDSDHRMRAIVNSALLKTQPGGAAQTPPDAKAAVKAAPNGPARPPEEPKRDPRKVIVLKDGRRITAARLVEVGDECVVRTAEGKLVHIPKNEIEKIEENGGR